MKTKKSQMDLVSIFIILGLSLFFVSAAYFWVFPNLEKITSLKEVEMLENQMIGLHNSISQVAREQSQRVISFPISSGNLRIRNDSILYSGNFKLPERAMGAESIVFGGIITGNKIECSKDVIGTLGIDEPVCLLKRGNLELELRYLRIEDDSGNIYSNNFIISDRSFATKGSHQIVISWINRTTSSNNIVNNIKLEIY